jgi:hypothetical protein
MTEEEKQNILFMQNSMLELAHKVNTLCDVVIKIALKLEQLSKKESAS